MDCISHQAPLSMGFSRQEYCNGLTFPSPGDLSDLGVAPGSFCIAGRFFTIWGTREAQAYVVKYSDASVNRELTTVKSKISCVAALTSLSPMELQRCNQLCPHLAEQLPTKLVPLWARPAAPYPIFHLTAFPPWQLMKSLHHTSHILPWEPVVNPTLVTRKSVSHHPCWLTLFPRTTSVWPCLARGMLPWALSTLDS